MSEKDHVFGCGIILKNIYKKIVLLSAFFHCLRLNDMLLILFYAYLYVVL